MAPSFILLLISFTFSHTFIASSLDVWKKPHFHSPVPSAFHYRLTFLNTISLSPPWSRTYDFPSYYLYEQMCTQLSGIKGLSSSGSKYLFRFTLITCSLFPTSAGTQKMLGSFSPRPYDGLYPFSLSLSYSFFKVLVKWHWFHEALPTACISFTPTFFWENVKPILKLKEQHDQYLYILYLDLPINICHICFIFLWLYTFFSPFENCRHHDILPPKYFSVCPQNPWNITTMPSAQPVSLMLIQ